MENWAEYGYWGLFAASFLAATVVPFSSEALLSVLIINGFDIYICLSAATMGNWLGGMSSYGLGRLGKLDWIQKYLRIEQQRIERFKQKVDKYGTWLAFLSWLPAVGDIIAVGLGFFRCRWLPVAILMLLGKLLRYIVWAYITFGIQKLIVAQL